MHRYLALAAMTGVPAVLSAQAPTPIPPPTDQSQPVTRNTPTETPQKTGRPVAAPPTPANHAGVPAGDQPHAAPGNANSRNPDPRG